MVIIANPEKTPQIKINGSTRTTNASYAHDPRYIRINSFQSKYKVSALVEYKNLQSPHKSPDNYASYAQRVAKPFEA